jgi:hypothetical protein
MDAEDNSCLAGYIVLACVVIVVTAIIGLCALGIVVSTSVFIVLLLRGRSPG